MTSAGRCPLSPFIVRCSLRSTLGPVDRRLGPVDRSNNARLMPGNPKVGGPALRVRATPIDILADDRRDVSVVITTRSSVVVGRRRRSQRDEVSIRPHPALSPPSRSSWPSRQIWHRVRLVTDYIITVAGWAGRPADIQSNDFSIDKASALLYASL